MSKLIIPGAQPPVAQAPQTIGYIVLQKNPGRLDPMVGKDGVLAVFATAQAAIETANAIASQELRPTADRKVLTTQMVSHTYLVCGLQVYGEITAKISNPEAVTRPEIKRN